MEITSGSENAWNTGGVLSGRSFNVAPRVLIHLQFVDDVTFRPEKSERQKDQVALEHFLRSWNFGHFPASRRVLGPADGGCADSGHATISVVDKLLGQNVEEARVSARFQFHLLVAVVEFEQAAKLRPRIIPTPGVWRLRKDLERSD